MAGYMVPYMALSTIMEAASGPLHNRWGLPWAATNYRGFRSGGWCHIWSHIFWKQTANVGFVYVSVSTGMTSVLHTYVAVAGVIYVTKC